MTSSQALQLLSLWQQQRALGIPPEDRKLPANDDDFEAKVEAIRTEMERVS